MMTALHDNTGTNVNDDGWAGLLDDDETILWQGRPDGRFTFKPSMVPTTIFGLFFSGFALFWMIGASQAGGIFWMFGLLHFGVGLAIVIASLFKTSFVRRRTWYTLTDKRAFIAKKLPMMGRSIRSYPITSRTVIEYKDADFDSILFANEERNSKNGAYNVPIGFEQLADGKPVLQMIRGIQKDAG